MIRKGYKITEDLSEADVVIVNTCGFINDAKKESIETILEYGKLKEQYDFKLIATGCLVQRYGNILKRELPETDALIGINLIKDYPHLLKKINEEGKLYKVVSPENFPNDTNDTFDERLLETPSHYAYLKIADGCNNRCSYCAIPEIKGPYRSRTVESILKEAEYLVENGVKEIILIAQDTTFYGLDLYHKPMLPYLLRKLVTVDNLHWVRLLYCYPYNITTELINVMAESEKICNYLDIPLQHADPSILKKMNRKDKPEDILKLIEKLRKNIPDIVLRSTFIVGFPGEKERHFDTLLSFLQTAKLDWAGFFRYSREEGTPAAAFNEQVPDEIKNERYQRVIKKQQEITEEINCKQVGKILQVVIDKEDCEYPMYYEGRSYRNAPEVDGLVYIKKDWRQIEAGDYINCIIREAREFDLIGEIE